MAVPPLVVATAREGWRWQWRQLMQGLGPADTEGRYVRPPSDRLKVTVPDATALDRRSALQRPRLVIGRSCPWAHRTWLMHGLRHLEGSLELLMATADHRAGRWTLEPTWMDCSTLVELYRHCGTPPNHRATVPALWIPETMTTVLRNSWAMTVRPSAKPSIAGLAVMERQTWPRKAPKRPSSVGKPCCNKR